MQTRHNHENNWFFLQIFRTTENIGKKTADEKLSPALYPSNALSGVRYPF